MVFGYDEESSCFSDAENKIYEKSTLLSGPMDSPWPMKCHDRHHTGRSPYSTVDNPLTEKWRLETEDWTEGGPIIDNDGIIYFGDFDRYLHAVYPNGTLKWKNKLDGWIWSTPAIAEDGTIYIGSYDCNLYAFNPNGTLKWKVGTGGSISSSPAIADDGTIYFGTMKGMDRGHIFAVNPIGTEKWRYETGDYIVSDPAIANDGTVYIGSLDNYLYAMNPNGTLRWRYKTGDWVKAHPSIADDGTTYFSSFDGHSYALNPNGTVKWIFNNPGSGAGTAVIAEDGTLYLGGDKLYAINPDGTVKWSFNLGEDRYIGHSSPAITADGTVFVGVIIDETDGGEIIAVNPDGTEHWRSGKICDKWIESSPCIGPDGTVYIGSSSEVEFEPGKWTGIGYLHAFGKVESNNQPNSPTINGPTSGKIREEQTYYFSATDPDNNPVYIYVEWGDGSNSGWVGLYASGESRFIQHQWSGQGTYTIKAKAKDTLGEESDWTTLEVSMPKNKIINPFERFLENHPRMFPILRHLMRL